MRQSHFGCFISFFAWMWKMPLLVVEVERGHGETIIYVAVENIIEGSKFFIWTWNMPFLQWKLEDTIVKSCGCKNYDGGEWCFLFYSSCGLGRCPCVCVCVFFLLFLTDNLHSCLWKNGNTFYQLFKWCIPQ